MGESDRDQLVLSSEQTLHMVVLFSECESRIVSGDLRSPAWVIGVGERGPSDERVLELFVSIFPA